MHTHAAARALADDLAEFISRPVSLRDGVRADRLQAKVYAAVDEFRDAGWPVERVLIAVKGIAADVGLVSSRTAASRTMPKEQDAFLGQLVRWSTERYFDRTDGAV